MKHALIVGVGGIVGHNLAELLMLEKDWKVTGIARSKPSYLPDGVNIIECDLLNAELIKQKCLQDKVGDVTHLYFVAWLEKGSFKEQEKNNLTMLRNIVEHTERVSQSLKHVYLQTGSKHYGMHIGPKCGMITPNREEDPRPPKQEGNFYYPMQDYLKARQQDGKTRWTWNESRPPWIIGFSIGKVMNVGVSLAVYATLLKEMGQPLIFPYEPAAFHALRDYVSASLLCKGILWMSTHDHCANNAFNIQNGDFTRMERLWPQVAQYFGMDWKLADKPFLVAEWVKDKQEIWNRVCDKYGLQKWDLLQVGTWDSFDIALKREWDDMTLTDKARTYGFNEHMDTDEMFLNFLDTLQNRHIIPPLPSRRGVSVSE